MSQSRQVAAFCPVVTKRYFAEWHAEGDGIVYAVEAEDGFVNVSESDRFGVEGIYAVTPRDASALAHILLTAAAEAEKQRAEVAVSDQCSAATDREASAHAAGFRASLEHRALEHEWIAEWLARHTTADLVQRFRAEEWRPQAPPGALGDEVIESNE